jgi:hypothetical protein
MIGLRRFGQVLPSRILLNVRLLSEVRFSGRNAKRLQAEYCLVASFRHELHVNKERRGISRTARDQDCESPRCRRDDPLASNNLHGLSVSAELGPFLFMVVAQVSSFWLQNHAAHADAEGVYGSSREKSPHRNRVMSRGFGSLVVRKLGRPDAAARNHQFAYQCGPHLR